MCVMVGAMYSMYVCTMGYNYFQIPMHSYFYGSLFLNFLCQINSEYFVNFCGLLRKHKLYDIFVKYLYRDPRNYQLEESN